VISNLKEEQQQEIYTIAIMDEILASFHFGCGEKKEQNIKERI